MNFAEAAFQVLQEAGEPLHFREITKRVMDHKLVEVQGLTPWNSMNGVLRRLIRNQGKGTPIVSLGEGKFALRSWNLPGEEVLTDEDEGQVAGTISIAPYAGHADQPGWRNLVTQGVRSARRVAGLMVPVAAEYKPLHSTLSTLFGSGLLSIVWGLVSAGSRKPANVGLANQLLFLGCAESAAAAVGLQQLTEAETDVVAGKMSTRQVQTQISAYERLLGYGTAVGATAFALGLLMHLSAPAESRTRGAGSALMAHGVALAALLWRTSGRVRNNPTLT